MESKNAEGTQRLQRMLEDRLGYKLSAFQFRLIYSAWLQSRTVSDEEIVNVMQHLWQQNVDAIVDMQKRNFKEPVIEAGTVYGVSTEFVTDGK